MKTVGLPYSDTSHYGECSLVKILAPSVTAKSFGPRLAVMLRLRLRGDAEDSGNRQPAVQRDAEQLQRLGINFIFLKSFKGECI